MDNDSSALVTAVDAFIARYRRYIDDMAVVKARTSQIRRGATFMSQVRPFADDPVHAAARSDLTSLAAEVTLLIGDALGSQALARVTTLVLQQKDADQPEYWPLVSLEGLVKPWLVGLAPTDLKAIYQAYCRANPRWQSLPNQRELRKEFERLLKR